MEKEEKLFQIMPFLKNLTRERKEALLEYFSTAPNWLIDAIEVTHLDRDVVFIEENMPADTVYIVGEGTIKATEFRIFGIRYEFMGFWGVSAMGAMEVIMKEDFYRTTLSTVTPCTMIVIPRKKFERWLESDIKALQQEAREMGNYLLEQGRQGRSFLFLKGADRLGMLLMQQYKQYAAANGELSLLMTRQELSEKTGMSVKTVNRAAKKLEEQNLITRKGHKILINRKQYEMLSEMISEILTE